MRLLALGLSVLALIAGCTKAPDEGAPEATRAAPAKAVWVDESVRDMTRRDGFLTLFVDEKTGKVMALFPPADADGVSLRAIYAAGLTSGLGSNPIGLDRGLFDGGSLIAFRRIGGRIVAEQENWNYRASSDNPLERKAVRESFARSFLWSGEVSATGPDGESLVDVSGFLTRDALGVVDALKSHPQGGAYSIVADRSFPDASQALAFPDNVEFDAYLTLSSAEPGREARMTAADARAITLVQHHSLVRLPDDRYRPRDFDVRAGAIDVPYYDFSAPLAAPVQRAHARRYRLERVDPAAAKGPVKKPIVFYVDSGAPPEIRDALIEGASWWADAFDAAGFENAFRVEPLPEGAHPRDIRYNIISWTHRQTRGWSYGGGVSDPRTGEMIKGSVILGSQRVRQDRMIFEGLVGADRSGTGAADDPVTISLARIRQLAAHEVGHSLGFAHNFAASTNNRASVMDYPAPLVTVGANGALDLSNAYASGIGEWDKAAATWLYAQYTPDVDEVAALNKMLADAYASGLRFVADSEARGPGASHPYGSVWDNGGDPVASLRDTMNVRRVALAQFGERSIAAGAPIAGLRAVIVPIYLYHRYQTAAASKLIGGYEFAYKTRGDNLAGGARIADERQRAALAAVTDTLDPAALDLPEELITLMTPPMGGFSGNAPVETFESRTGPQFDILAAAGAAADVTFEALLHPDRAARLLDAQAADPARLGFTDMLVAVERRIFAAQDTARRTAIGQEVQTRFVSRLVELADDAATAPGVAAAADMYLKSLRTRMAPGILEGQTAERGHREWLIAMIDRHLERPAAPKALSAKAPVAPPGSPIGAGMMETCWHCEDFGE